MTVNEFATQLTLTPSNEYGHELNSIIASHNMTIESVTQNLNIAAIINILLKKNIIASEDEYNESLNDVFNSSLAIEQRNRIIEHFNAIAEIIESEKEFIENMKNMHENLEDPKDFENIVNPESNTEI